MAATFVTLKTRGRLDRVNFRNEFWDCYQGQLKKNGPSSDPRNNCATHFGSRSLSVSKVANVQSTPCPNQRVLFYPSGERTLGTRLVLPLALAWFYLSPMQTDATLLATTHNVVEYHMLRPFAHPPCCMLLEVVAQSLKPVKRLSTCKRTEQLPTCWANNVESFCTSTVEREQNLGGIWQYQSFGFFFFSSPLSQSFGWMSCAHLVTQNNLLSTFFGLFGQASEARKDSGKLEFVYRKRGCRSADQPEDSGYEEHSDKQFIYTFCFFCRYI